LLKEGQNSDLYKVLIDYIPKNVVTNKNRNRSWLYGYNSKYDVIVISKTGLIGDVIRINNLTIALPLAPKKCLQRHKSKEEQYWERKELPKSLSRINSIFQWNEMPKTFKNLWVDYIEQEFDYREYGYWFKNNGIPTYITGAHYMYLQWTQIDVGYPDFREANRLLYIFWEACKADKRSFGMIYLKIRRSGFSFMSSSECVHTGTLAKDSRVGILSKTGSDAKKMFTDKVVPINSRLPFFFRPIMDGMDKPKTELAYRVPAAKITKKNMYDIEQDEIQGLDTTIDWKNTDDNSYDGEKLLLLVHDESGKWLKPNNILNNWRVTKTCLRLGSKIIGKCMMGSTSNALNKGGNNFKQLYYDSDVTQRNANGQTKTGLYSLFIPMEWNMEGFIDRYGNPVFSTKTIVRGIDDEDIQMGAIDYWENEVESLKKDPDALNEYYRQFPRTESHAFRDESKQSLFNLTRLYQQIDYNDSMLSEHYITQGTFSWENGIKDSKVKFFPDKRGRFNITWVPNRNIQNNVIKKNGILYPGNEHIGAFGCDSYDISGTVGGVGSNGALHGLTKFSMEEAPTNEFFLEYIARPQTAEIFFEDVLMACVFYGMPILIENNKPRLLYHFKNRGYRGFCMNRPDKTFIKLSKTEKELGGIPNSSEDVKQAHAAAIESYIESFVGMQDSGDMGQMYFNRTLEDWARFDISNRTKFDASISSGLAIMACQKHLYQPERKESRIMINFARYSNKGNISQIIR
tara:strand:- start:18826 stop:21054 length:2229 start_codon:yes stop_codon:yes gene_type:complete